MKDTLTNDIKDIYRQSVEWLKLETRFIQLTVCEKATVLMSAVVLGAVMMLLMMIVIVLLSLALVGVFEMWMQTGLAYLCVSGIVILLAALIYLLRKPLLINPIARFVTRLVLDMSTRRHK